MRPFAHSTSSASLMSSSVSDLPVFHGEGSSPKKRSASEKRYKYLRRIFMFRQMDFEFAIWQLIHLCVAPQKVYLNFQHRKRTKDQWARDDPSFLILLGFFLVLSSILFALWTNLGVGSCIKLVLWVIFVDTVATGMVVASIFWFVANKYLISPTAGRGYDVEWGYAFDVHLNSLFPVILILHVLQLPLVSVVIGHGTFLGCLIGNTLWLFALCYYVYITFLGYKALPFLRSTQLFLYPMTALVFVYILSIMMQWNFTSGIVNFYHFRLYWNGGGH